MAITQDEHAAAIDREIAAYNRAVGATNQYAAATARAAEQAAAAQTKVNQTLGVRDDFGTAARQKDIESYGASLDNLRTKYVPLAAAEERRSQALAEINTALAIGDISGKEHAQAIERTNVAYAREVIEINRQSAATSNSSRLLGLNRLGMLELQAAGVNAFQALASGQEAWRVVQTESAQVLGAFIQGGEQAFNFLKSWGPALAVATVPLAAFASAVSLVFERSSNLRAFNVELSTIARGLSATVAGLQEVVEHLERIGVSAADARTALQNMLRQVPQGLNVTGGRGGTADILATLAQNISAVRGTEFLEELRSLNEALLGNVDALNKYALQLGVITGAEAAANVERAKAGQLGSVQTGVINKLAISYKDAAENSLSPFERAIRDITNAWRDLAATLAEAGVGNLITGLLHEISETIKRDAEDVRRLIEIYERIKALLPGVGDVQAMSDYIGGQTPTPPRGAQYSPAAAAAAGGSSIYSGGMPATPYTPPPPTLVGGGSLDRVMAALIQTESGGNQGAISSAGAIGLTQLMPRTAKGLNVNPYNAEQNVEGGTRYLLEMTQKFGSFELGLMAYNFGPRNVEDVLAGQRQLPSGVAGYASGILKRSGVSADTTALQLKGDVGSAPFTVPSEAQNAQVAEFTKRLQDQLAVQKEFGVEAAKRTAEQAAASFIQEKKLVGDDAEAVKTAALAAATQTLGNEFAKTTTLANMQVEASARITAEYNKSIPAGIRQTEIEKAKREELDRGAPAQQVATQRLQENAEAAIQASAQQDKVLDSDGCEPEGACGRVGARNGTTQRTPNPAGCRSTYS